MAKQPKPPETATAAAPPAPDKDPDAAAPAVAPMPDDGPGWYEVQAGTLPKSDIQAPCLQTAKWMYMQRWMITHPEPTAKRVA